MKCPTDSALLVMSERGGVEIDYCPECRGIWLDRGELDKIIERAEAEFAAITPAAPAAPAAPARPVAPQQQQYQDPRYGAPQPQYGERDRDRDRNRGGDRDRGYGDRDRDRGYGDREDYRGKKKESWLSNLFE